MIDLNLFRSYSSTGLSSSNYEPDPEIDEAIKHVDTEYRTERPRERFPNAVPQKEVSLSKARRLESTAPSVVTPPSRVVENEREPSFRIGAGVRVDLPTMVSSTIHITHVVFSPAPSPAITLPNSKFKEQLENSNTGRVNKIL